MLTMKDVIREGHPTLREKAVAVKLPLDEDTKALLKEMRQFLIHSQDPAMVEQYDFRPGVGLAAPQVNRSIRAMAIYTTDENYETLYDLVLINPVVLSHSTKQTYMPGGEGCLSIDREVEGLVPRHHKITFKAHQYDPIEDVLEEVTLTFKGFLAVVFQHELDHLNGVLFPDRIEPVLEGIKPLEFKVIEEDEEKKEEATS